MEKLNKADIPQEAFDLYDYYCHNKIDRRTFVEKLSVYAVGGITVSALLSSMIPDYLHTQTVSPSDKRLQESNYLMYLSPKGGGEIKALCSIPEGKGKFPGIVVVHENRGLNPYIEDVGRRCAVDGFISLAPDALTPLGGYPGNDDEGRAMQAKRTREEMLEDFIAAYEYLKSHPRCNGKVGVVGFCFGGWISNMMAVGIPDLKAAVPFYGGQPEAADVPQIKAPLLIIYAALDERVNAGWPAYEQALVVNGKTYEMVNYPGVNHGFHNNTTPRYDEAAAKAAWEKTISFFKKHVG
ncbi:MAG: dienelactone hydrolase family protein [Bacteroidetes bacterium]|nr:dienelactone hydrolase family protein [Bacteroidota bacterium]